MLFSSRPAFGHLYPMMPLAYAARDAGHQVVFSTGRPFVPTLESLGFGTHETGMSIQEASQAVVAAGAAPIGPDGRTDMAFGGRVFIETLAGPTIHDLVPVIRQVAPDVVMYGQFEFGAPVAAALEGIPAVSHGVSPQMPSVAREAFVGNRLDELWTNYSGCVPAFDAFVGAVHLDIIPPRVQHVAFADQPGRVPMQPIPWNEPGFDVPEFVQRRSRSLVYLTLGTMIASDDALRAAIDGLATLDADVLVARGSAPGSSIGSVPDNVHVEAFVDQARLMPYVDLVVHHGGSGTMLAALACGVPQVLIPKGADQFLNADRMAGAGLASVILPSDLTPDAVATAAKVALVEPDRAALDAARSEIEAMPDPVDVAAELVARFG